MEGSAQNFWRKCSTCKKPMMFGATYFVCSVSTCNGQRTGYVFCSVGCFESHLPGARHREAGAIEKTAPAGPSTEATPSVGPARIIVKSTSNALAPAGAKVQASGGKGSLPREVLVIASRLKEYIHAKSEFNTSASVMDVLSDHLRVICDRGIENARAEGRKTVLDRDFEFLKRSG